ncbi:MAG TPA: cation:proton antiporter [Spirochaetota bacterium]|mgnify:FL=1|nr:cation:proton antiporter [Spirochaetota bacterium]HPF05822.1 cation:proton antiporter [Spirochaetota bacterium]HPR37533.1 cation:proton antiporter [Spirochaetota bacterium]
MVTGEIIQTILLSIILGSAGIVLSDKFRIPGILFYFAMGIIAGPGVTGILNPQSLGNGLSIMITVFVIIILFEGGLSLDIKQLATLKSVFVKEITLAVIVTVTVGYISARFIAGLPWEISIIFASLVVVTGPTVIKPVLRYIALSNKVKNFLNGESVLIDAVGAILAIITLEFVLTRNEIFLSIAGFAGALIVGTISGLAFGFIAKYLVCRTKQIPPATNSFFILGFVFLSYISSEAVAAESGLLTVVIMGIIMSTMNYREKESILKFKEQITRIVISILFVILSANFNIRYINLYLTEGLIVVFILILSRFPVIFLSTIKEDFSVKEKIFMSWLGPRGIIALSVASIAAIKLKSSGMENAYTLEILVFMLISVTVLLQGTSAKLLAEKLGILVKGDRNLIILGVNSISLMIAEKWRNDKTAVLFVDSSRKNCKLAAQKGFACCEGNALDPATYFGIEMDDYSSVLAASDNNEINVLFCTFIKDNFGINNLYTILNNKANEELSEIIHNEDIKLAFGAKSSGDENFSWDGFLSRLKDVFSRKKQELKWFQVTSRDFINNGRGKYPLPEGVTIFMVVRNNSERYIFHTSFELHLHDEIYVMASQENYDILESTLYAAET